MPRGPTPFKFENMWLKVMGFKETNRSLMVSYSNTWINENLKRLKMLLKILNCEAFREIKWKKDEAPHKLNEWDRKEDLSPLSHEEKIAKIEATEEYSEWVDLEEIS